MLFGTLERLCKFRARTGAADVGCCSVDVVFPLQGDIFVCDTSTG